MTTAKRISLLFAWYVTIVVIVFGIVVNIAFFISWYRLVSQATTPKPRPNPAQQYKMQQPQWFDRLSRRPLMNMAQPLIVTDLEIIKELKERERFISLISYQDQVRHYRIQDDRAILTLVDPLLDSQLLLIYITLISAIILALLSYGVSIMIVRRGLRPLYLLADHVHHIQDPMDYEHLVVWPPQDELQQVSSSLTYAMSTIAQQTRSLKQFVTHASHELKTPLMTISSSIDVMTRSGIDTSQTQAIKSTTQSMKRLIDRLMMTMRYDTPQQHKLDITQLIPYIIKRSESIHPQCEGRIIASVEEEFIKHTDPVMCESIISNLIENACKYAVAWTQISITADHKQFIITNMVNPGSNIDLEQIWQPFYQWDDSHTDIASHGLWLSIVQQYVQRLGREIAVKIEDDMIIFTIDWN